MSLAATLAAQGTRPASFLPAIKCSRCGNEIEIASMGDHLCIADSSEEVASHPTSLQPYPASSQNPYINRQMNVNGQKPATSPLQYSATAPPGVQTPVVAPPQMVAPKPRRIAPPRIDSGTANRPFLAPRAPRSDSPMSPAISVRSARSARANLFDFQPPSPEIPGNLDCAFPPFPTAATPRPGSRPGTSNGRHTPGSDRSDSRNNSRADFRSANENSYGQEPMSPRGNGGVSFDGRRRRPSEASTVMSDRRRPSTSGLSVKDDLPPLPTEPLPSNLSITRPSPAGNNFSRPAAPAAFGKPGPPPRIDPSIEDMPPPPSNFGFENTLTRIASEPDIRGRNGRPSLNTGPVSEPSQVPQFRPRSSSRGDIRTDFRLEDAPPVPMPVQQTKQDTTHSPSQSTSSAGSIIQSDGNTNDGPSSIGSAASSLDAYSPFSYAPATYEEDPKAAVADSGVTSPPGLPGPDQLVARSPPRNFARPSPPKALALVAGPDDGQRLAMPASTGTPLESPADPMLLTGAIYQPPSSGPQRRPMPTRTATTPNLGQALPAPLTPLPSLPKGPARSQSSASMAPPPDFGFRAPPPPVPQGAPRSQTTSRRSTSGKSSCRGCGLTIEGKSIKAADGRLTGRWHKACFTCKTCDQPFTTADFYVIANLPYCEQHYHEKNDSCCHGCRRGIEGQYLETSSGSSENKKFHPRCFTCVDCRQVLSDDYFELAGRVFCERHALAAMRGQARMAGSPLASGLTPLDRRGLTAERRTTKLMMM